jgi:hypothetical protein
MTNQRNHLYRWPCKNHERCGHKRRQGDVFCKPCYMRLPKDLRSSLWVSHLPTLTGNIVLCMVWFDQHWEDKT